MLTTGCVALLYIDSEIKDFDGLVTVWQAFFFDLRPSRENFKNV
jgi:hypothetical protein